MGINKSDPALFAQNNFASALLKFKAVAGISANAALVAPGPRQLGFVHFFNAAATPRYLKLFDKVSAPVPATDTPVMNLGAGPNSGVLVSVTAGSGIAFAAGLGIAMTAGIADLDATVTAMNDCMVTLLYV